MILGPKVPAGVPQDLGTDEVRVSTVALARAWRLASVAVYMDGLGPGAGPQNVRAVVYAADGTLLASSEQVSIAEGQDDGWVTFHFPGFHGVELPLGDLQVGVHGGPTPGAARVYRDATADGHRSAADAYADGTAAQLPATALQVGVLSAFVLAIAEYEPPADTLEDYYARLPFELAQRILGKGGGPLADTRLPARAGFHGTDVDLEEGSNAIVRSDGPLADRVGERLRITARFGNIEREVFVYCHDEQDWPDDVTDEDLSLTRRAWLELAIWPVESLDVNVETMA